MTRFWLTSYFIRPPANLASQMVPSSTLVKQQAKREVCGRRTILDRYRVRPTRQMRLCLYQRGRIRGGCDEPSYSSLCSRTSLKHRQQIKHLSNKRKQITTDDWAPRRLSGKSIIRSAFTRHETLRPASLQLTPTLTATRRWKRWMGMVCTRLASRSKLFVTAQAMVLTFREACW